MRSLALAALLALAAGPAGAADRLNVGIFQGATVTTSDQTIVGPGSVLPNPVAGPISKFVYLENVSASATICVAFGVTATISSGVCSAGEIGLQPGAWRFFDFAVPTDTIHAIGSASAGLTVGVQ